MAAGCCIVQIFTIWIDQFCLLYGKEDFKFQEWWIRRIEEIVKMINFFFAVYPFIHYPSQSASIYGYWIFGNFRHDCDMPDDRMNSLPFYCWRQFFTIHKRRIFISILWNEFVLMTFFIIRCTMKIGRKQNLSNYYWNGELRMVIHVLMNTEIFQVTTVSDHQIEFSVNISRKKINLNSVVF